MNNGGGLRKGTLEPPVVTRDFALVFLSSILFLGSLYLLIPILPLYLSSELNATKTQVGFLMGALTLASMVLRPYVGRKSDSIGRKPFLVIGAADFVIASLLYIVCRNIAAVAALLLFHGLGIACFHTASLTFIGDTAPASQRGKSMSWFQASFNIAIAAGPPLGMLLADRFGHNAAFLAASATAAAALLLIVRVPESRVSVIEAVGPPRRMGSSRGVLTLACIGGFTGTLVLGSIEAFIGLFAESRGISQFAYFFTISAAVLVLLRFTAGSVPDRLGRRTTLSLSLATLGGSALVLAWTESFGHLCLAAAVFGAGFAFMSPSISAMLVDRVPPREMGSAFGIYTAAFEGGIAFGSILMGPVTTAFGFTVSYLVIGTLTFAGSLFVALAFRALVEGAAGVSG